MKRLKSAVASNRADEPGGAERAPASMEQVDSSNNQVAQTDERVENGPQPVNIPASSKEPKGVLNGQQFIPIRLILTMHFRDVKNEEPFPEVQK
jgi:hypothetical protein